MTHEEQLNACVRGSTGFVMCMLNATGKLYPRWKKSSVYQNELVYATTDAKTWAKAVHDKHTAYLPDDYFDVVPEQVWHDMMVHPGFSKSVKDRFKSYNLDLPPALAKYA